ncbi:MULTISPECIES: glycosyltransferase family 2 protein [Bacillus cereus group]|uniref:glycosyltransferase family 2 protein n=1 Tax=Bacillus cereus group TaxID=86661 RepID=UPI00077856B4|nr:MULTISPECIES: glycosyltransferase family 2 protein [Bacillus cereus group]KXY88426.1 glycosyl transferase [Bacillus cereus]
MKPFMSACLIVKNEEDMLGKCLQSLRGYIDDIVVVDTGSTDMTKEIAKEFTDKVYDFKWMNDFAVARNFATSKASGEWILAIDADECVDGENLKKAIEEIKLQKGKYNTYFVNIINFLGEHGDRTTLNKMGRIYINNGRICFKGALHEQIVAVEGEQHMAQSCLTLYHYGYLSHIVEKQNKKERNLKIVTESLRRKKNDGFSLFNYGQELRRQGKTKQALDKFVEAYKYKKSIDEGWISTCLYFIIESLVGLKRYDDALKIIQDTETIWPAAPDFMCWKGDIYCLQNRYTDAKAIFETIITNQEHYKEVVYQFDRKTFIPHERLGRIYEIEKNDEKALQHYIEALNENISSVNVIMKITRILSKYHSDQEVYEFLVQQNILKTDTIRLEIIKYLLSIGLAGLPVLLAHDLQENALVKAIELKASIITIQSSDSESIDVKRDGLLLGVQRGILDLGDLCVLYEMTESIHVQEVIQCSDFKHVFEMLFRELRGSKKIKRGEYLAILEKALRYNKPEFVERLITYTNMFPKDIYARIADVFYETGYDDIALEFYQLADENHISKQGYVNIIEWLINQNNKEEAQRIALQAIELFKTDFRFYKYSLDIAIGNTEGVMLKAVKIFPDSEWLKMRLLVSL